MGSSVLVELVIGVVGTMLVVSAVATTLAVRSARRRVRAFRSRLRHVGSWPRVRHELPAMRATAVATLGSPAWWVVQADRHRMWRAVSSAEHAVAVAARAGAPVGDLPTLSRQLSTAADGVDAVLRASARNAPLRREVSDERRRLEEAAAELQRAAVESLRTVAAADTEPVLSQVRVEVAALGAGLRAAHRAQERPAG